MLTRAWTKQWSPSPCTDGGSRTTDTRKTPTPFLDHGEHEPPQPNGYPAYPPPVCSYPRVIVFRSDPQPHISC
jgi:hypothetical protein